MTNLKLAIAILLIIVFPVLVHAGQLQVIITSPQQGYVNTKSPTLIYSSNGDNNIIKIDGTIVANISGDTIGPLTEGPHTVRVEASSVDGSSGFSEVNFTVDTIPPSLIP